MSNDIEFVQGLRFNPPNEKAPEYVKAKGSIRREDLIAWLQTRSDEWVNFDVKVSQGGKWYAAVDNWKPEGKGQDKPATGNTSSGRGQRAPAATADDGGDDIPFVTNRGTY